MHLDRTRLRNTLLLLLASFLWGTAFVAQSVGSEHMGPYTFLACRSWLGCAFLAVLALVRGRRRTPGAPFWQAPRRLCCGGLVCGTVLFAASASQQMGVGGTSTAKAGFLTALYVVLVPVFGIFFGRRQRPGLWACVGLSVAGLYLLCMAGRDTLSLTSGEWQLLLCAVLFSWQIMAVGRYSPGLDGVQLSLAQFSVVTVLSTIAALWREGLSPALLALPAAAWGAVAYCGIFSTGVAYTLQIVGQQDLDPTIASLAMCLESVWSAVGGWVVQGQALTPVELTGCALMFAAIVGSQLVTRPAPAKGSAVRGS